MKRFFNQILAMTCLLAALPAAAADRITAESVGDGETEIPNKYWICVVNCPNKDMVVVRLDNVTSISQHNYTVDGVSIREVTIDTRGNNSIRFYVCTNERVNTMQDRMKNTRALIDQKSGNATSIPGKKYPEGTCSHNVEYQLNDVNALNKLYESVVNSVVNNKGCKYKVK